MKSSPNAGSVTHFRAQGGAVMYLPKHFRIDDEETIRAIMREHGFAILVSRHRDELFATHVPLALSEDGRMLSGHLAKANPQWHDLEGQRVLVIFQGPHTYITPAWYETERAVPTWSYVTVHAYGKASLIDDPETLRRSLRELVQTYEPASSPYRYEALPEDYLEGMTRGVVGITVRIDRLEAKAKISQNHPLERQRRVAAALRTQRRDEPSHAIAAWMEARLAQLDAEPEQDSPPQ